MLSVRPHERTIQSIQIIGKQTRKVKIMFATAETLRLASWIVDDTFLVHPISTFTLKLM